MSVTVTRRGYALGAEITGVDASKPLDTATVDAIQRALRDHIVVYLPGQDINAQQFKTFVGSLGEIDTYNTTLLPRHPDAAEVVLRANQPVVLDGKQAAPRSPAADKWHSDYSYSRRPASISALLGKQLPSIGGDTMFANSYAAFETLSPAFQRMIEPLMAIHDNGHSAGKSGYEARGPEAAAKQRALHPPVIRPLLQTHPDTGRKALFINGFLRNFEGMTPEETKPILDFLMAHSTRYENIYRHRWTTNDLLMWDNRYSLHYAVQDYAAEMRMLFRCSLLDSQHIPAYEEIGALASAAGSGAAAM